MHCTVFEGGGIKGSHSHEHKCHFALLELSTGSFGAGASHSDSCQCGRSLCLV